MLSGTVCSRGLPNHPLQPTSSLLSPLVPLSAANIARQAQPLGPAGTHPTPLAVWASDPEMRNGTLALLLCKGLVQLEWKFQLHKAQIVLLYGPILRPVSLKGFRNKQEFIVECFEIWILKLKAVAWYPREGKNWSETTMDEYNQLCKDNYLQRMESSCMWNSRHYLYYHFDPCELKSAQRTFCGTLQVLLIKALYCDLQVTSCLLPCFSSCMWFPGGLSSVYRSRSA